MNGYGVHGFLEVPVEAFTFTLASTRWCSGLLYRRFWTLAPRLQCLVLGATVGHRWLRKTFVRSGSEKNKHAWGLRSMGLLAV